MAAKLIEVFGYMDADVFLDAPDYLKAESEVS
jgi:hypothetical protein